jgi:hypothetical protein
MDYSGSMTIIGEEKEEKCSDNVYQDSMEPCGSCGAATSRYCCPRCQHRSCSLVCLKQHKVDAKCSGQRDRCDFIPIQNFTTDDLVKDYRFLEEVAREDDGAARRLREAPSTKQTKWGKTMMAQAKQRSIQLRLMAPGMKRRRENTSAFNKKQSAMMWRVEWRFESSNEACFACDPPCQHAVVVAADNPNTAPATFPSLSLR